MTVPARCEIHMDDDDYDSNCEACRQMFWFYAGLSLLGLVVYDFYRKQAAA